MKFLAKHLPKLSLLLLIVFTVANCEKDGTNDVNPTPILNDNPRFKMERITNPPISQNKALSEKLNSIMSKGGSKNSDVQAREIYNPELDFIIDTDVANYIEYGAYHSFTFPIFRVIENGLTENLLLSLQNDGTYLAYLISYDLTEEEKELIRNNELIDYSDKTTYTILQDQNWVNTNFSNRVDSSGCLDIDTYTTSYCEDIDGNRMRDNGDLDNGCYQNYTTETVTLIIIDTDCMSTGGGSGGGINTGGGIDSGGNYDGSSPIGGGDGSNSGSSDNSGSNNDSSNNNDGNNTEGDNSDCLQQDANGDCVGEVTSFVFPDDECDDISDEAFNASYSRRSPFNVDLSDFRESCDNIDTSNVAENAKFMCIYNKLTASPSFKNLFIDTFGESQDFNVKFELVDLPQTVAGVNITNKYKSFKYNASTNYCSNYYS